MDINLTSMQGDLSEWYKEMFEAAAPLLETMNEIQKEYRKQYYKPFIDEYRNKVERAIAKSGLSESTYALRERNKAEDYINRLLAGQPSDVGLTSIIHPFLETAGKAYLMILQDNINKAWWPKYQGWWLRQQRVKDLYQNKQAAIQGDELKTAASMAGPVGILGNTGQLGGTSFPEAKTLYDGQWLTDPQIALLKQLERQTNNPQQTSSTGSASNIGSGYSDLSMGTGIY